ncbi:MAG TPA: bifunctional oligoribonuclease/PAP phosphatase NrnA [Perlabentimonas sp.]|nr:bifunctional oligoribonuclease/PAP phosphatase NrnA [Bacteroidales bacterium]MDD4671705.1 bifunctional oligoribonuclease/PAP phosphatase NrnA [Bacteroidales bacterium]MDY0348376.1 bifunctional oligoribonuclease/PAP phosphatase NrnA [Tenuifilaceae bacterium]HZJ74065.1 bifunctional oligoribonuclease/PAP phosphatase NrnA [Perlabentimonas sp.]
MCQISVSKSEQILALLKSNPNIIITTHSNPDGDAIGSSLGLFHMLKTLGIKTSIVIPNEIPDFLAWLPGSEEIVRFSKQKEAAQKLIGEANVIFALDFNGPGRLEEMKGDFSNSKAIKILIDHHPHPEDIFDWKLSETKASSTAELVYEFATILNAESKINLQAAQSIFTGIMTDTGSFSYGCSNPRTFEIAAKLISKGAKVEEIQQQVYNNFSENRMRLMGHALTNKMKVFPAYRSAFISLTRKELNQFKYKIGDTEGLVNLPLSIKNIIFSALLIENTDYVKVSLRSAGNFEANKICEKYFNGGGHINAAGGKSFVPLSETEEKFIEILKKHQNELKHAR